MQRPGDGCLEECIGNNMEITVPNLNGILNVWTVLNTLCQRSDKSVLHQPLKLHLHDYRMIISLVGSYQPKKGKTEWLGDFDDDLIINYWLYSKYSIKLANNINELIILSSTPKPHWVYISVVIR